jgi:hypothetical protein
MNAFLIQDIITGASAHLVVNVVLGLIGAGFAILAALGTTSPARR